MLGAVGISSLGFVEGLGLTGGPPGGWAMIWGPDNWGEILQEQGNRTGRSSLKH